MPDAAQNRILSGMTMCRRAGKLVLGFDAVKDAAQHGTLHGILLAADCAARTEKEIRFHCPQLSCERLPFSMEALTAFFTKRTAVFGVTDEGFARLLRNALQGCSKVDACEVTNDV